uniref:CSON007883 protein n=1 Tax=Culicoides sonorensis TaxID=179676 RepID=A0A336MW87_CULSO
MSNESTKPFEELDQISSDEKSFLSAVDRGDLSGVRRILKQMQEYSNFNINTTDSLGRSALMIAIDNENLEMVELLVDHCDNTYDALLHAISEEFVEAVEVLLECDNLEPKSENSDPTSPDPPLVLAAHRDNYEIIKILLDKGYTMPMPHDIRCGCSECICNRMDDSLKHSKSRISAYQALSSPSLICLSSKDPILTAFELSWELRRLSKLENEFKTEYQELRAKCMTFTASLLDHVRSSNELEIILNHDPYGPPYEQGERMKLSRLKLAVKLKQKKFVSHSNVQQLLTSIWYDGLPGFRRKNMALQLLEILKIGFMFPFLSIIYIIMPHSKIGSSMRKPFIKFICHSASYFMFLFLLILASQRIETIVGGLWDEQGTVDKLKDIPIKRGESPTIIEWLILIWVMGQIWDEVKQLWTVGIQEYVTDMWNIIDFVTNSLYVATVALRIVSYCQVRMLDADSHIPREKWDAWDPMLLSEGLFSAANIFSSLKLVYIFSVNPHLGPLQISLSRMVMDIIKFFFLYVLVLFAFSSGLNQLLWYYASLERKRCVDITTSKVKFQGTDPNACYIWRRFSNLFETAQSLFWAVFGLIDLDSFELEGIKVFTRFWGMLIFGTYSVINIVVLLNLLVAMMNHSYQLIFDRADMEFKFARSKLWISYFEEGGTVPVPFNIIPSPKTFWYIIKWIRREFCNHSKIIKKEQMKTIKKVRKANERDTRYKDVMRNLVRRFITANQKRTESQTITEDDVNEIKQDISAFRCEIVEILKNSGICSSQAQPPPAEESTNKKKRPKMRKLVKGYSVACGFLNSSSESRDSLEKITDAVNLVDDVMYAPGLTPRRHLMFPNHARLKESR